MSEYVYWIEDLQITKIKNGRKVLIIKGVNTADKVSKKRLYMTYTLNNTAAEIIQLIDGTRTYNDIITYLNEKYNEDISDVKMKVMKFLDKISQTFNINIKVQQYPQKKVVTIVEEENIYPGAASIELTNKCNIRCRHCYGDFGNTEIHTMDKDQANQLLTDLYNIGVKVIELTGGECTTHPHIEEIVAHACNLDFGQISLLSNGVNLSDKLIKIIIENKSKTFMQIDLQSLNDEYVTWFTKVPNTINRVKKNISTFAKNNIAMRVVTTVTPKNLHEIEHIANWVHDLNISKYGVTLVVPLGRALNSNSNLILNEQELNEYEKILEKINSKYQNFLSLIDPIDLESTNCGCLTSQCMICANGDIKICTMDNLKCFNSSIGNVLNENIKNIYDKKADYIEAFRTLCAPGFRQDECIGCKNIYYCNGCIFRGLVKAKEDLEKCSWYKNLVPQIVKDQLYPNKTQIEKVIL